MEEDWFRLIGTDRRGWAELNDIPKPSRTIERTHLFCVNSPPCSTKLANLPPTGISGRGKIMERVGFQNFVEDEACLDEGNCFVLLLLLEKSFLVLDVKDWDWVLDLYGWLCLGLVRLALLSRFLKRSWSRISWLLLLLYISICWGRS